MKIKDNYYIFKFFILVIFMLNFTNILFARIKNTSDYKDKYQYKETKEIVEMVETAVALINQYGEDVFDSFRKKNSFWFKDNKYIFIDDMSGVEILNPAFPSLEGKNIIDLQDAWGKYMVKDYIREVYKYGKNKPSGWFHFLWPRPDNGEITWKSTYVAKATTPEGMEYVVGSGGYDMKMEPEFMIDAVYDAINVIKRRGLEKALDIIAAKDEEFFYKDTNIFVVTDRAEELVNKVFPNFPNVKDEYLWQIQDIERKYVFKDIVNTVREKGQGWVLAAWYSKSEKSQRPEYIHFYVKGLQLKDKFLIIGTSAILEDIQI